MQKGNVYKKAEHKPSINSGSYHGVFIDISSSFQKEK